MKDTGLHLEHGDDARPTTVNAPPCPTWIVYGLLENREADHDLRFIERSQHPQQVADAHPEYEACMAFPEDTADQLEPGMQMHQGIGAAAAMFLGPGTRWPNAAERA